MGMFKALLNSSGPGFLINAGKAAKKVFIDGEAPGKVLKEAAHDQFSNAKHHPGNFLLKAKGINMDPVYELLTNATSEEGGKVGDVASAMETVQAIISLSGDAGINTTA